MERDYDSVSREIEEETKEWKTDVWIWKNLRCSDI